MSKTNEPTVFVVEQLVDYSPGELIGVYTDRETAERDAWKTDADNRPFPFSENRVQISAWAPGVGGAMVCAECYEVPRPNVKYTHCEAPRGTWAADLVRQQEAERAHAAEWAAKYDPA